MLKEFVSTVVVQDKNESIKKLIAQGSPRREFFTMVVLAISMAAFGLLLNSTVILIGSMLIAPVLYSVLSISLSLVLSDQHLLVRSLRTLAKAMLLGIAISTVIGLFFPVLDASADAAIHMMSRRNVLFMSAIVAGIGGFAASYAMVKPQLSEALPGIAISASLIPPLAAVGIGVSKFRWDIISGSLLLFFVNVVGIVFTSLVVFSLLNFAARKKVATAAVKQDEKEIKKEETK